MRHLPLADQETLTLSQRDLPGPAHGRTTPRHQLVDPKHLARCGGDLWQARALSRAAVSHLTGTITEKQWINAHALPVEGEPFGPAVELFHVPSVSEPWRFHTVGYDAEHDRYRCTCVSGGYSAPCRHSGAVLHFILTVRENRAQARRDYENGTLDWQDWWDRQSPERKAR